MKHLQIVIILIAVSYTFACSQNDSQSKVDSKPLSQNQSTKVTPQSYSLKRNHEKLVSIEEKKRVLMENIPKDGELIYYLGKEYSKADFQSLRLKEVSLLKKELYNKWKIHFKTRYTKYFNIAYNCSDAKMNQLQRYLTLFFNEIYPKYFKYEPTHPINVVYFNTKEEYSKKTDSTAYGFYRPDEKRLYTYSYSGHGTLWHEMIHAFMDQNLDVEPHQWFNEGLASFYEMAFLQNNRVSEGYTNWRLPELKQVIQEKKLTPLKRFIEKKKDG